MLDFFTSILNYARKPEGTSRRRAILFDLMVGVSGLGLLVLIIAIGDGKLF